MVKAVELEVKMGDVDIGQTVPVDVRGVDAHAGFIAAILAGGEAGDERDVGEGAVVIVLKEEIGPGIIGDGDVGPSVIIQVGQD